MGVAVCLFQTGLVHVLMGVLGPVVMAVWVLVGHVIVIVRGVFVGMGHVAVPVFVGVRRIVGVLFGHRRLPWVLGGIC